MESACICKCSYCAWRASLLPVGQEFKARPEKLKSGAWTPDLLSVTVASTGKPALIQLLPPSFLSSLSIPWDITANSLHWGKVILGYPIPSRWIISVELLTRGALHKIFTLSLCGIWAFPVSSGIMFAQERFTVSQKHVNWALVLFWVMDCFNSHSQRASGL